MTTDNDTVIFVLVKAVLIFAIDLNNVLKFLIKYDQSVCKKRLLKKIFSNVFECPVGAALCAIMRIFLLQNLMKKYDSSEKYEKSGFIFTF